MDKNNLFLVFMAVLFALTVFPIGVNATLSPNGSFETGDATDWDFYNSPEKDGNLIIDLNSASSYTNNLAGFFYARMEQSHQATDINDFVMITSTTDFLEANKTYNVTFDYAYDISSGGAFWVITSPSNSNDTNYSIETCQTTAGNLTNSASLIDGINGTFGIPTMSSKEVTISTGADDLYLRFYGCATGGNTNVHNFAVDNIKYFEYTSLVSTITKSDQPANVLADGYIYVTVKDSFDNTYTDSDANVTIDFDGDGNVSATWDSTLQKYKFLVTGRGQGTYGYIVYAEKSGAFTTDVDVGSWEVSATASGLEIECISNCSTSLDNNVVLLNVTSESEDVVFSVTNPNAFSVATPFKLFNEDKTGGQYWIYTSSTNSNYVLSETLTFGVSNDDSVQKIWDVDDEGYYYTFSDSSLVDSTKYYKLVYDEPALYWETIGSSLDWINHNPSNIISRSDGEKFYDVFQDSTYSSIDSMTYDFYPELTSTDLDAGFYLQFTAYTNVDANLEVGYTYDSNDVTETVQISTVATRYSVLINPDDYDSHILFTSDGLPNATFYITDYAIIPISYFTKRLEIKNFDNSHLGSIQFGGVSYSYVREGFPLIFNTSAYDKDADLDRILFYALIGETVIYSNEFGIEDGDRDSSNVITWDSAINGVIDLNGFYDVNNLFYRDITFRAVLVNDDDESVSEQTETLKIIQYPYFAGDIITNIYPLTNKVGETPRFNIELDQELPEHFLGFRIRVYTKDENLESPSYDEYLFNKDFQCTTFNCQKQITLDGFVFEEENTYTISVLLLLATENEILGNPFTEKKLTMEVKWRTFETARIFQVWERSDFTYRNDEPIQIVLQLRDVPYRSTKDTAIVSLYMDVCATAGGDDCTKGTTNFSPSKHIYDDVTGYNYYYWDNVFYDNSGNLFSDGNYIQPWAFIEDSKISKNVYDSILPTLAKKCTDADFNDIGSFLYNWWEDGIIIQSLIESVTGCTTPADSIIGLGDDYSDQKRILIDIDHAVLGSVNQSVVCTKYDNEAYQNSIDNDMFCMILYKRSEQSLDQFRIQIGNENSDYAKEGNEKQYLEFTIPVDQIMFNDPFLMAEALNVNYGTSEDTINTFGELFYYLVDDLFTSVANPIVNIPTGLYDSGVVTNINWDQNYDGWLDPLTTTGVFFIKIEGLKVINQYPYSERFPELELLDPEDFLTYAKRNGLAVPVPTTFVTVLSSDLKRVSKMKLDSPLVVYEAPARQILDVNGDPSGSLVGTRLKFNVISDMIYNNYSSAERIFIPLTVSYIVPNITDPWVALFQAWDDFVSNPFQFFLDRWFWVVIIILGLYLISLIYRNFKNNGTAITINNPVGKDGSG